LTETTLTADRILDAAEEVLTRYGPQKANVVDVARALGVSHGSVYRHFASKAALRDAVTERWLERVHSPLARIVAEDGPAADRLHRWFLKLIAIKRQKAAAEPELFATYQKILAETPEAVRAHVDMLVGHVGTLIADGIRRGEFAAADANATARAAFYATVRFHAPAHAAHWSDPGIDEAFEDLWGLLQRGLSAPPRAPPMTTRPPPSAPRRRRAAGDRRAGRES
jgi:AcrR family transcriptional regulator